MITVLDALLLVLQVTSLLLTVTQAQVYNEDFAHHMNFGFSVCSRKANFYVIHRQ